MCMRIEVQCAGKDSFSASTSTNNRSICGNISFYDCINTFSMNTIDKFIIKCHLTMLVYIENELVTTDTTKIDTVKEIDNYSYTLFRSYTKIGEIWPLVRHTMGIKDINGLVSKAKLINNNLKERINDMAPYAARILKDVKSIERKEAYTLCNTTFKNLSKHSEAFNSYVYTFKDELIESNFTITITFGAILFLLKNEEVSDFLEIADAFKIYRIVELMQEGILDIFRGLIQILYKSNLKSSISGNSNQDVKSGNSIMKIDVNALRKVFLTALCTAKNLYTYHKKPFENNSPLQSVMSFISRTPSLSRNTNYVQNEQGNTTDSLLKKVIGYFPQGPSSSSSSASSSGNTMVENVFKNIGDLFKIGQSSPANSPLYEKINSENEDIGNTSTEMDKNTPKLPKGFKMCMEDLQNYWISDDISMKADTILNGRLFKENKVQSSVLQFYSSIETWPSPIEITSETNELEVLLLELNGWSEILYYFVTDDRYTGYYKHYRNLKLYDEKFSVYKQIVNGLGTHRT